MITPRDGAIIFGDLIGKLSAPAVPGVPVPAPGATDGGSNQICYQNRG